MNETSATITMATASTSIQTVRKQVLSVANVGVVSSSQSTFHRWDTCRILIPVPVPVQWKCVSVSAYNVLTFLFSIGKQPRLKTRSLSACITQPLLICFAFSQCSTKLKVVVRRAFLVVLRVQCSSESKSVPTHPGSDTPRECPEKPGYVIGVHRVC